MLLKSRDFSPALRGAFLSAYEKSHHETVVAEFNFTAYFARPPMDCFLFSGSEHKLNQNHIYNGAGTHGEDHLFFPEMENGGDCDADQFGDSEGEGCDADVFQTVYHQHSEYGAGENSAKILDVFWSGLACRENEEGQKAHGHGAEGDHQNGNQLLGCGHDLAPAFSACMIL